jgi:DNA-binding transcriptional LysR family regulator
VSLFVRRHRTIAPTDKGNELYAHAKHMLATLDYTERLIKEEVRPLRA